MAIRTKSILGGVFIAFMLSLAGGTAALSEGEIGTFSPAGCMFEGIDLGLITLAGEDLGFECGYVTVPVRHANPDGPTIRLPVAIRRATAAGARPDPLILAQGGPGGDAFEVFSLLVPNTRLAANRDIVIFNQRGTPYAEPELTCPETEEILPARLASPSDEADRLYNEALSACYARLQSEGIDLSAFNSLENAADIPVLVKALGYDAYNFYGVSYGTLLGLHLMRNHPEGLRSVILDSVVPADINFINQISASEDRVLKEVFAACAADADCNGQYPNLEQRYFALIERLNDRPVTIALSDPDTGERHEALIDGDGLRLIIFRLLYVPYLNVGLPKIITDLEQGDMRYIENMYPLLVFEQMVAEGMYYSVVCAEDADIDLDLVPLESLAPAIAKTTREDLQTYIDACARWQVEQLPSTVDDPVMSDIPTLLLAGRFDPITPPRFAEAAAAGLTRSTVLVDPVASHGVAFFDDCVNDIVSDFLDDPSVEPAATCLANKQLSDFVPPDAVTVPLLAGVNSLDRSTLAAFGIAGLLLLILLSPFALWPIIHIVRALGNGNPARSAEARRLRLGSRSVVILFAILAFVFAAGLVSFIVSTLVSDLAMMTALVLPPVSRPLFWIPILLLALAVLMVAAAFMLWTSRGASSMAGKVYYTILAIAALALVLAIGAQGLLVPPL